MLKRQLTDAEIIDAVMEQGFHAVRDDAHATTLNASRRALALAVLERQSRATPLDVGASSERPYPAPPAAPVTGGRAGRARTAAAGTLYVTPAADPYGSRPTRVPIRRVVKSRTGGERAVRFSTGVPGAWPAIEANGANLSVTDAIDALGEVASEAEALRGKARRARSGGSRARHLNRLRTLNNRMAGLRQGLRR